MYQLTSSKHLEQKKLFQILPERTILNVDPLYQHNICMKQMAAKYGVHSAEENPLDFNQVPERSQRKIAKKLIRILKNTEEFINRIWPCQRN
jgi:hypothetical protein